MQKIVIEKSVAEEIKKKLASYEQVKNEEKACESGEFVEKTQNLALTEENEQILGKLQASEIEKSHLYKDKKWINGRWVYRYSEKTSDIKFIRHKKGLVNEKGEKLKFKIKTEDYDLLEYFVEGSHDYVFIDKKNENNRIPAWTVLKVDHNEYLQRKKLRNLFKTEMSKYKQTNFKNKGLTFRFSQKSIDKLTCDKAVNKSALNGFSSKEHFEAALRIKELVENVDTFKRYPDKKGVDSVKAIYRGNVPIQLTTRKGMAYITIKEYEITGKLVYSVELMLKKYPSQKSEGFKGRRLNKALQPQPDCGPSPITSIPQTNKKSRKELQKSLGLNDQEFESYLFSIQGSKIHKSFNVEVTDITENNKYKKVEQVEKTLRAIYNNVPFVINHIDTKGDNSEKYQNITLGITDFNKEKIEKAVHSIALALDVEPNVSNKGEPFLYKAQEEFTNNMIKEILKETKKIYLFVIDYFNLPDIRVISKANLRHKGKIVYNPETGKPITKKEWEKFLKEYEKLCQKIYGNFGEKLVMSSEVVGRMLDKITQKYPMEEVKKMSLKEMENLSKTTVAKLTVPKVFYQTFSKNQYFRNRIELAEMSITNLITTCNENAKNKIKQILIDGIKNKDNKSKIGQQIFERCVGLNTDIQRIVDTEIQNNVNAAIIRSNVENKKENEKIYFKRSEIIDNVTCKKCKAIKGMVVLFSENPLTDEKIKDQYAEYAIWEGKTEGKVPFATMHPYCRGTWYRYYPRVVKK